MGMALLQDHANLFSRMFPCQMIVMLTRGYVVGCSLSLKSSGLYRREWKQNWLVGVPICTCSISKGCFGPSISFSHNDDQSHGKHPREAIGTCPCIYYEYDVSVSSQDHMEETPEASGFLHFKSLYASFSSCVPFCQGLASTFLIKPVVDQSTKAHSASVALPRKNSEASQRGIILNPASTIALGAACNRIYRVQFIQLIRWLSQGRRALDSNLNLDFMCEILQHWSNSQHWSKLLSTFNLLEESTWQVNSFTYDTVQLSALKGCSWSCGSVCGES